MPRFRFRLEPLLTARRHVEQERQRAVAEQERRRRELEEVLRRQQQFITEGKSALRAGLQGTLDLTDMRAHAGATLQLMRRAQRLAIELAGVHTRLEAARVQLIEATRDRRAIELLKERRFAQWKAALEKAEHAAVDELAVQAAARKESSP